MISELLSKGEQNARTARELATITRLSVRDVMQIIRNERLAGRPICSNGKGYFLPANGKELKDTVVRLFKQAKATKNVALAIQSQCKAPDVEKGEKNGNKTNV